MLLLYIEGIDFSLVLEIDIILLILVIIKLMLLNLLFCVIIMCDVLLILVCIMLMEFDKLIMGMMWLCRLISFKIEGVLFGSCDIFVGICIIFFMFWRWNVNFCFFSEKYINCCKFLFFWEFLGVLLLICCIFDSCIVLLFCLMIVCVFVSVEILRICFIGWLFCLMMFCI